MFKKLSLRFPFYFHIKRSVFGFFETGGYNLLFMFSIPNFIQSLLLKADQRLFSSFLSTGITTVLTMTFLGLEARKDLPKVRYLKCTEENNYYYDYIILYICIQNFACQRRCIFKNIEDSCDKSKMDGGTFVGDISYCFGLLCVHLLCIHIFNCCTGSFVKLECKNGLMFVYNLQRKYLPTFSLDWYTTLPSWAAENTIWKNLNMR